MHGAEEIEESEADEEQDEVEVEEPSSSEAPSQEEQSASHPPPSEPRDPSRLQYGEHVDSDEEIAAEELDNVPTNSLCVVCQCRLRRVVLMPCAHRCMCRTCSVVVDLCPLCRKPIAERVVPFD